MADSKTYKLFGNKYEWDTGDSVKDKAEMFNDMLKEKSPAEIRAEMEKTSGGPIPDDAWNWLTSAAAVQRVSGYKDVEPKVDLYEQLLGMGYKQADIANIIGGASGNAPSKAEMDELQRLYLAENANTNKRRGGAGGVNAGGVKAGGVNAGGNFSTALRYGDGMSADRTGTGVAVEGDSGLRSGYAPYVQRMLERASAEADVPFQKYTGISPLLESARAGIANLTTPAQFLQGSNLAQAAGIGALDYGKYQPTSFTTGTFANPNFANPTTQPVGKAEGGILSLVKKYDDGGAVNVGGPSSVIADGNSQVVNAPAPVNYGGQNVTNVQASYMSPYMQNVVDAQQREAKRQSDIAGQYLGAKATQAGAFGGSRYGLVEAENQRNLARQLGDIQAKGLQEAYTQGLGQFNTEQQRALEAQKMGEQSRQFGAELGLKGLQTGIQAGQALGNLGQQQGYLDLATLKQMADMGKDQQQFDYQEFLRGEKYPYENLTFMKSMLQGLPFSSADSYQPGGSSDAFTTFLQALQGMNTLVPGKAEGGLISGIASLGNDD